MNAIHKAFLMIINVVCLASCGSGIVKNIQSNGYLMASYDGNQPIHNISVTNGSTQKVYISLQNSTNIAAKMVNISLSNPTVASVYPSKCSLSSGSRANSTCLVTVNGLQTGSTNLNISSDGYLPLVLNAVSGSSPVQGTFEVESSDGNFYSGTVNVLYSASAKSITIKAGIFGSSGIDNSNSGVLNFAIQNTGGASLTPNGAQSCDGITSAQNYCIIPTWSVSGNPTTQILFNGSVAGSISTLFNYPPINVIATQAASTPGNIVISSQNGNFVPFGMRAPVFVNWVNSSESGTVTLNLSLTNNSVMKFYSFNESGIESTFSSVSCYLNSSIESELSCGFGVKSLESSGSSSIVATLVSQSGAVPTVIESLVLNVALPEAPIRSLIFTNNSAEDIWVGITQGGANAFTSPTQNVPAVDTTHALTPGGVSMCGLSNPRAACPVGSTCRPGGANGGGSMFCFWDRLEPSNGYKIESHGGITSVNISASSQDPNGIIWSGNFFARTKCNESGICEVGSCGNGSSLACAPGTGAAPGGVVTLGEFTFQSKNQPDYYDVSIINGVNVALSFGPSQNQNPLLISNAYSCGMAGSVESMAFGQSGWLPASTWIMLPDVQSYPSGVSVADPSVYYRWVSSTANESTCFTDSDCTGANVCGYHLNSSYNNESGINQGANSNYQLYCGLPVAWLTADTIAGFGSYAIPNNTPVESIFNLNANWSNPVSGSANIYVTNLQLCNLNTFSSFTDPAPAGAAGNPLLACGGTLWSSLTRANSGFTLITNNQNWQNNVLPTITWLKRGCPTCYTYPFDDPTSTFTCTTSVSNGSSTIYNATFIDLQ